MHNKSIERIFSAASPLQRRDVSKYGDEEITVEIENGKVNGTMSKRALSLIREWRKLHKEDLLREWELVARVIPGTHHLIVPNIRRQLEHKLCLRQNEQSRYKARPKLPLKKINF